MIPLRYVILNKAATLFWSNKLGWIEEPEDATQFNVSETTTFHLPIDGMWVSYATALREKEQC